MSAKELAFTIAGLIATFFMPWPGAWNASEDPVQVASPQIHMAGRLCEAAAPDSGPALGAPQRDARWHTGTNACRAR